MKNIKTFIEEAMPLLIKAGLKGQLNFYIVKTLNNDLSNVCFVIHLLNMGRIGFRTYADTFDCEDKIKPYLFEHNLKEGDIQELFIQLKPMLLDIDFNINRDKIVSLPFSISKTGAINLDTMESTIRKLQ